MRLLRGSEQRRALAILLCSSAAPVVLAQLIGHYDVFTLLGGILFGLSAGVPMAICSGVFTGFANAEQGVLMAVCAACVAWGLSRTTLYLRIALFALACVGARLIVWQWFAEYGWTSSNRTGLLSENLSRALIGFLRTGMTGVYTWHGPLWGLIALVLWSQRHTAKPFLGCALGLVLLPAAVTITTLDGTRVFVCCALPALCFLLREWLANPEELTPGVPPAAVAGILLIATPLLPAFITWTDGQMFAPWLDFNFFLSK
jgi:hypothetical protein